MVGSSPQESRTARHAIAAGKDLKREEQREENREERREEARETAWCTVLALHAIPRSHTPSFTPLFTTLFTVFFTLFSCYEWSVVPLSRSWDPRQRQFLHGVSLLQNETGDGARGVHLKLEDRSPGVLQARL